jgi:hypothetical protein
MKLTRHREDVKYLIQTDIHNVFELDEIAKRYRNMYLALEEMLGGWYVLTAAVKRVLKDAKK